MNIASNLMLIDMYYCFHILLIYLSSMVKIMKRIISWFHPVHGTGFWHDMIPGNSETGNIVAAEYVHGSDHAVNDENGHDQNGYKGFV